MATIKSADAVHGVMYTIADVVGNEVQFLNGQQFLTLPLQPQVSGSPTILVLLQGTSFRLTASQATTFAAATGASAPMVDVDSKRISFATPQSTYAGGTFESANTSGMRITVGGVFADLSSTNLTDIDTVMNNFVSVGAVT